MVLGAFQRDDDKFSATKMLTPVGLDLGPLDSIYYDFIMILRFKSMLE